MENQKGNQLLRHFYLSFHAICTMCVDGCFLKHEKCVLIKNWCTLIKAIDDHHSRAINVINFPSYLFLFGVPRGKFQRDVCYNCEANIYDHPTLS